MRSVWTFEYPKSEIPCHPLTIIFRMAAAAGRSEGAGKFQGAGLALLMKKPDSWCPAWCSQGYIFYFFALALDPPSASLKVLPALNFALLDALIFMVSPV
jgi:hypothetical protein